MSAISTPKAVGRWQSPLIGAVVVWVLLFAGWMAWSAWRSADLRARARSAAEREDWERNWALLTRLAWYKPNDREVLTLRAQAALNLGDKLAAARLLARIPPSAPEAVEARLAQGRLLLEAFRLQDAEAAYRDCLRIDPGSDAARLALIAILAVQHRSRDYEAEAWALFHRGGEPIKALRLLAEAAPTIPPDTFARTADLGDVLRRCLAADAADVHTRLALARFERGRGDIDEALRLIEPCLRTPPAVPEAELEWAACLLDEGEPDRLRPLFENPADSVRGLASFWLLRGEWARRQGLDDEALRSYREAVRLDPRSADAHYRLGLALRDGGPEAARHMEIARKARALKDAVAQVSDKSREPAQFVHLGRLCAELGRDREARAWFALALRVDPDHDEARAAYMALDPGRGTGRGEAAGVAPR